MSVNNKCKAFTSPEQSRKLAKYCHYLAERRPA